MVTLGIANSRMKDFYDLLIISRTLDLEGVILAAAIRATFQRRDTPIPNGIPLAFTLEFAEDESKQTQWRAFLKRSGLAAAMTLGEVISGLSPFLMPMIDQARNDTTSTAQWKPESGWV